MQIQTVLAEDCEMLAGVEIIARIRPVRYNKIQIPSSDRIILVGRDLKAVKRLLREKNRWICRKLAQLKEMEALAGIPDGQFYYFGELHCLDDAEKLKEKARDELLCYATEFLRKNTAALPRISVRRMRSRLGSYSVKKDEIRLSSYLVFLPKELVDYIIFHELVHRDARGHGRTFWKMVEERYADWKIKEKELDLWWLRARRQIMKYEKLKYV